MIVSHRINIKIGIDEVCTVKSVKELFSKYVKEMNNSKFSPVCFYMILYAVYLYKSSKTIYSSCEDCIYISYIKEHHGWSLIFCIKGNIKQVYFANERFKDVSLLEVYTKQLAKTLIIFTSEVFEIGTAFITEELDFSPVIKYV